MPFPESPRVVYERNPLEEVICQLRFPTILRIDAEMPAAFQEMVRNEYPLYTEAEAVLGGGPPMPPEVAQVLRGGLPVTRQFHTQDQVWKIGLTRDFLSLSTRHYERWEQFRERLAFATSALEQTYRPAFLSRVGLRYRNIIHRPTLGLNVQWSELLMPHVAAELSSQEMAESVSEAVHLVLFKLDEQGSRVQLRHGLESREGLAGAAYVLDADFFTDSRMETQNVVQRLDYFNRQAGCLFRWCITDALHQRLGSHPVQ